MAAKLGLRVEGVSFHVGSRAADPQAFKHAIRDAALLFDVAKRHGHRMSLLDIGGGFTSSTLPDMSHIIQRAISSHPVFNCVTVISEPGRYFVEGAMVLAANIIASRQPRTKSKSDHSETLPRMLYLNDGIYGSFLNYLFEPAPSPRLWPNPSGSSCGPSIDADTAEFTLWGPTCDGTDLIVKAATLPQDTRVGDWLVFPEMGAYTTCLATAFNGFSAHREIIYVD